MNLRRLVVFLVFIFILIGVLLVIQGDYIRQSIAVPLSYALWIGVLILRAVPQVVFWVLLVLIGVRIAGDSLFSNPDQPHYTPQEVDYPKRDRVDFWLSQIYRPNGVYAVIRFGEFFRRLILEVLAHQYRMLPAQIETLLRKKSLDVPPALYAYVTEDNLRETTGIPNWFQRIKALFLSSTDLRFPKGDQYDDTPNRAPDGSLESIIQFLEGQLEKKHDH